MSSIEPPMEVELRSRQVLLLAIAWVCAVAWPLATYTVSLALFGGVHVLSELRYVDLRFGRRFGASLRRNLVVLLVAIAAIRWARQLEIVPLFTAQVIELGVAATLVVVVLPQLRPSARIVGGLAIAVLGLGIVGQAAVVLLGMAFVHNLTPWCFAVAGTTGLARRRALVVGAVVFVGLPASIVSGWPFALLNGVGITAPEATLGLPGPLSLHMPAYLGSGWLDGTLALHAFSACVFLQCAHYVFVVDVLPRTLAPDRRGLVPWPRRFGWVLVGLGVASFVAFAADFFDARGWYGGAAAVHAWIELPVLLLAFSEGATRRRTTSRSS